jgi:hypothetical protein
MRKRRDNTQEPLAGVNLVEMEIDRVNVQLNLANIIPVPPGKAEPPHFTGDASEFEDFMDRNFPRGKYASLRRNLDKAARRKVIAPIELYRWIVQVGKLLRSVTAINDSLARLKGKCPVLRICDCGKIFEPKRRDQETCSTTCRDRIRQAKFRYNRDRYKENRIRKEDEAENQTKGRPRK